MGTAAIEQDSADVNVVDLAAANARAAAAERELFADVFKPRVRMDMLTWAESRYYLSPEANAIAAKAGAPVKYSSALTPYHREVMAALSDPRTEYVVCKFPSQDGKTELLNMFYGWRIDLEPGPMLFLNPTEAMAQTWSKDRLAPMLRDNPTLRGKVRDARSRDSENTILHKKFPGGHLTAVGSMSAAQLAMRPIRDVGVDEVDRCAKSAGSEGDSLRLAFRRTTTFRGKKFLISSPTIKDDSRIDSEYMLGTQEEMLVPCPHCGEYQALQFGGAAVAWGIKWDAANPEHVWYVCRFNGCVIEEHEKAWMLDNYVFVAHNPGAGPVRRSFTKTAWASNLASWRRLVAEWIEIQGKVTELQTFINTVNCELWDPMNGKEIKLGGLVERLGIGYPETNAKGHSPFSTPLLPPDVAVLTRSVDVQDDRLETAVWGWGHGEEGWLVEWESIPGDPGTPTPWRELDIVRARSFKNAHGVTLRPTVTFIDSGGHHTKSVYSYCRTRLRGNVFAIKGSNQEGAPLLGKPTRNNSAGVILYMVGSFTGKESLASRLVRITQPGPGYVHLPLWLDTEQVQQFTRSKLITPAAKGGRKWLKPKRAWEETGAVEQFHLYVYALAALQKLGHQITRNLGAIARRQNEAAARRS
ncbi:MAG TPA: terminase gpA endonuclease subunit, partial [Gemmatimonadaceae bacterium]